MISQNKTILKNINSNDIKFLKELSTELNTQDYGFQAQPAFWTIGDYGWIQASDGCGDRQTIYAFDINEDHALTYLEMAKDLVDLYYEYDIDDWDLSEYNKDRFVNIMEDMKNGVSVGQYNYDNILTILDLLDIDYSEHEETKNHYIVPNTFFLTKREAENHLQENKHHYTDEVHPYLMTAWRSPEFEKLLGILRRI